MSLHVVGAQAVSMAGVGCLHELSYLSSTSMLCFAIYDRIIGLLEISIVYPRHFKFLCMCPKYLEKNTERQQLKFSMCNIVSDRCKL